MLTAIEARTETNLRPFLGWAVAAAMYAEMRFECASGEENSGIGSMAKLWLGGSRQPRSLSAAKKNVVSILISSCAASHIFE